MTRNVLITGGAGYIGSILTEELVGQRKWEDFSPEYNVTVIDNFKYDQASLNHLCRAENLEIINGDVRDSGYMWPHYDKADIIIPLAALVGAPICDKDFVAADSTNKYAILQMFEDLPKDKIVIMPTTNSSYGTGDFCTEESPLNPISKYAKDKVEVERRMFQYDYTFSKTAVSLRLATVFGMSPRMRIDLLVNDFVYRAVKDRFVVLFEPHFKRNYIHVRDVVSAMNFAIINIDKMGGQVYNVGLSDANVSKYELCQAIQKRVPDFVFPEDEIGKDPDQRNYIVSNAKIEGLGWKPLYSLDDGIVELIKGYKMLKNTKYGNV